MEYQSPLDEYQKLILRMNTPRVVIDNLSSTTATLIKVDSARDHVSLLDTIQVLTDLNLSITKAYVSSDGPYFMDVFHVTDIHGRKLTADDDKLTAHITHSIQTPEPPAADHSQIIALELTGIDRPGLLSEIFAVLSDLNCVVAQAKIWTHNGRIASVLIADNTSTTSVDNVEARLRHVLQGSVAVVPSAAVEHRIDRRLHQMMSTDKNPDNKKSDRTQVSVDNLVEKGYSIITVGCKDRPNLLFDIVCTLTDMNCVVFHGNIDTAGDRASQEFYVRRTDGTPIVSKTERNEVVRNLQAAIERRSYDGLRLELCTLINDRLILSEATRVFRENGLRVTRAEVSRNCDAMTNIFYITDACGNLPNAGDIEFMQQRIGIHCLVQVHEEKNRRNCCRELKEGDGMILSRAGNGLLILGSLVLKNIYNLGLIRSCS